jgi:hypothetical protein
MARGDFTTFEEFSYQLGTKVHNLSSDTLKLGLIDNTAAPTAADSTPRWGDYSANEVSTEGGYTEGGITLSGVSYTPSGGVSTLDDTGNISLAQNGSGFTDAYWGILYNDTATNDEALGFIDLGGPVSEQAGPIEITWNASGIQTVTVSS